MSASKANRNDRIQVLRGLAILCVVLIHTAPLGLTQVFVRPLLNLSVATFIFVSGWLTRADTTDWLRFWKKRILRTLIPYVLWVTISSLPAASVTVILRNLVTSNVSSQFYFVLVYIQLVLLTPLIAKLASSRYRWAGWLIAPLSVLLFQYPGWFLGVKYPAFVTAAYSKTFLGWFSFYYLGFLLGNRLIRPKFGWKAGAAMYLGSLLLQMLGGWVLWKRGEVNCGTQLKLTSLLTSGLFLTLAHFYLTGELSLTCRPARRVFVLLGDCSFGIFLIHMLVLRLLKTYLPVYASVPYCLNGLAVLLLSLALVWLGRKAVGEKAGKYIGLY